MRRRIAVTAAVILAAACSAGAERIKDIVDVQGERGNPLTGFGLVVGLNGTGDDSAASRRALANILSKNPQTRLMLDPKDLASKNIAWVAVTATLPPFKRRSARIDVTVSALGDAKSLQGGTLLTTQLAGVDGQVYAVAHGYLTVGGYSTSGEAASVTKNHPVVGRIADGATIEREEIAQIVHDGRIVLQLKNPDVSTARRIAEAINTIFKDSAKALDAATVRVTLPKPKDPKKKPDATAFMDKIGSLDVKVDLPALVVINERTGTIIVGQNVKISTVAISHGTLTVITEEKDFVSQPTPFSRTGTTEKVHRTEKKVIEEKRSLHVVPRQVSVSELAQALNAMGLTPRDLISIFEALKQAGALQAKLKIM